MGQESFKLREEVDRIADQFENAWQSGERSDISELLQQNSHVERIPLLLELLTLEIEFRRAAGESPTPDEYLSIWPGDEAVVREVFALAETVAPAVDPDAETKTQSGRQRSRESAPAKRLGDYEILERIGRGGMGVVYRARQISLGREVALKTIRAAEVADSDEEVTRFRAEAEAAAMLKHPGIVPVYQFGQESGQWFLSMELVEGGTLADLLRVGPVEPRRAAELMQHVADAVAAAHAQGVVHRDLKPGNVLIDKTGQPRVADFGLAKRTTADSGLTATGQVLGTPSYMPPEQARGDLPAVGPLADVYSLGAMLYCLVTGRPPFQAASVMGTLDQVLNEEPVLPRQLNPAVPQDLQTIAMRCLAKDRQRRYGSASMFAEELGRYLRGEPILARPIGRPARAWRWCRRNPVLAGLTIATVLLLVTVAATATAGYVQVQFALQREQKALRQMQILAGQEAAARKAALELADKEAAAREEAVALAEENRTLAVNERSARLLERKSTYLARLQLAAARYSEREYDEAERLLFECPIELRDTEWKLLSALCRPPALLPVGLGRVQFHRSGNRLAVLGGSQVDIYDLPSRDHARSIATFTTGNPRTFIDDSLARIVSILPDRIGVWSVKSGKLVAEESHDLGATLKTAAVEFVYDRMLLVTTNGSYLTRVPGQGGGPSQVPLMLAETDREIPLVVGFSPDGRTVAAVFDRVTRVYDAASGNLLTELSVDQQRPRRESPADVQLQNAATCHRGCAGCARFRSSDECSAR